MDMVSTPTLDMILVVDMEKSHQTASLANSPDDILHIVFKLLPPADLYAVCLSHSSLRALATPYLYSRIEWQWGHVVIDWKTHRMEMRVPPITLLLRSILRRPQLAAHTQGVALRGRDFDHRHPIPRIPISEAELTEPIAFLNSVNIPSRDSWIQELRRGTMDAFVALLLSRLSNLRRLHLGPNLSAEMQITGMLHTLGPDQQVDTGPLGFPHLEHVSLVLPIDMLNRRKVKNTDDILNFFYLPAVRHIKATIDNPITFSWPTAPPTPSSLVSLKISAIRETHLGHVLSVTTRLTSLRWKWLHNGDPAGNGEIDLNRLMEALSHVRKTLKNLAITADTSQRHSIGETAYMVKTKGTFTEIAKWDALRTLEVPLVFLTGWALDTTRRLEDAIPKNIEFLTIRDDFWMVEYHMWTTRHILELIRSWLANWRTSTPRLRQFTFAIRFDLFEEYDSEMKDQLTGLCAAAGVQFKLITARGRPW